MEGMFKGIAWLSVIALATGGALTFVPDPAWDSCPQAFAPVRARLASVGIAPVKYRISPTPEPETESEATPSAYESAFENFGFDEDELRTRVQIGDFGREPLPAPSRVNSRFTGHATTEPLDADVQDPTIATSQVESFSSSLTDDDFFSDESFASGPEQGGYAETTTYNTPNTSMPPTPSTVGGDVAGVDMPVTTSPTPLTATPLDADYSESETLRVSDFPEDGAPLISRDASPLESDPSIGITSFPEIPTTPAALPTVDNTVQPLPNVSVETVSNVVPMPTIPSSETNQVSDASLPSTNLSVTPVAEASTLSASDVPHTPLSAQPIVPTLPSATIANQSITSSPTVTLANQNCNVVAPTCETASCSTLLASGDVPNALEVAMRSAQNIGSSDQAREVFVTLNQLRRLYLQQGQLNTVAQINGALDRLAFEIFYNPQRAILEPIRRTLPGETLASIAREYEVTPETLAAINGLQTPVNAPLPTGTNLKVVRGPVTAEISVSRKELLLNFNNLYAGRFRCGLPQHAAGLRGLYYVERKLENPECRAVDMTGAEVMIPGGSADNPLGSCWIGLNDGYGLQGTNRPELIGADVPENGGFVFSNREISQLNLLLPIGSEVSFTD